MSLQDMETNLHFLCSLRSIERNFVRFFVPTNKIVCICFYSLMCFVTVFYWTHSRVVFAVIGWCAMVFRLWELLVDESINLGLSSRRM